MAAAQLSSALALACSASLVARRPLRPPPLTPAAVCTLPVYVCLPRSLPLSRTLEVLGRSRSSSRAAAAVAVSPFFSDLEGEG